MKINSFPFMATLVLISRSLDIFHGQLDVVGFTTY